MRFPVDAQLPPGLCNWLEAKGHAAEHVHTLGMTSASDSAIADHAHAGQLVLISKDEDFRILRRPDRFALLWLRCGNTTNTALATWLELRWQRVERLLAEGERFVELR